MKSRLILAALLSATALAASAQPAPFDMTIERETIPGAQLPPPVQAPVTPVPITPTPAPAMPVPAAAPAAPVATPEPPAAAPVINPGELRTETFGTPAAASNATSFVRPIIPFSELLLAGETASRSWTIYLTAAQAASPATFNFAFINALLIAPEFSTVRVLINDRVVIETALDSSEQQAALASALPTGLLHAGVNRIRFEATQRHRTDCTIQSTYELWTQIDPAGTNITFADPGAASISRIADLRAVGVDEHGRTTVNLVVPSMLQPVAGREILRLAQGLALNIDATAQNVRVSESAELVTAPGTLNVVFGTIDEIDDIIDRNLLSSVSGPAVSFVSAGAATTLVVTGRTWPELAAAVDSIIAPVQRPLSAIQTSVSSRSWHFPEVPMVTGGDTFTLAELGVTTTEFSGRRFRADFAVAMPADLYAQAYGYATLFLDAAYAADVEPGGHIDVYVNGQIAVTTPIVSRGGGIFRHLAVEIPFRHFEPGVNFIEIEAIVPTAADVACLPGATGDGASRFVLFDTTELAMPDFARAAQLPDLAALVGTGYPFATQDTPITLLMGRTNAGTFSAAATFLSRLAVVGGRTIDVNPLGATSSAATSSPYGLFVGTASQMPTTVATEIGIVTTNIDAWGDPVAPVQEGPVPVVMTGDNDATFQRWRNVLSEGGGWRGQISSFSDWIQRTFDISLGTLRFGGAAPLTLVPPENSGLILAQGGLAAGQTSWTVLTAPSVESLAAGTEAIVDPDLWWSIGGQAAIYRPQTGALETIPLTGADLVMTEDATPANLRLVATNWLSKNLLIYGTLLVGLCILLGVMTAWLLKSVGRQPE